MEAPVNVRRGVHELRQLLQEQAFDLRGLQVDEFRRWLDRHLARWRKDPVFVQRGRIRDLRRAHPRLEVVEEECRRAALDEAASPQSSRLRWLEQELFDTHKAVAGLTAALTEATPERCLRLQEKLADFQTQQRSLQEEQSQLIQSSPQRQHLTRITTELQQLRSAIGLDREETYLATLQQERGRRSGRSGKSFEELALTLTRSHIVPELLPEASRDDLVRRIRILRSVTLGAAGIELDQVVIHQPEDSTPLSCAATPRGDPGGGLVEVLAVVEAKRNSNDLAHGFQHRQENLGWLIGDADSYDPQQYRTKSFPSGHFDREVVHKQDGETFVLGRRSFQRFRREPGSGLILDPLYFITRTGPIWGVSTRALARIHTRIARDERWAPEDDSYLGALLRWCQHLTTPMETPDVLRMYTSTAGRERNILVVDR